MALVLVAGCSGRDMGNEWFPLREGDEQTLAVSYRMDEPREAEEWVMRVDEPSVFQEQPVAVRQIINDSTRFPALRLIAQPL